MALVLHDPDKPVTDLSHEVRPGSAAAPASTGRARFRGLSNQGATCYMNSLLQTLFMTPEFRNALYTWQHDPDKDDPLDDCIPAQLQSLFGVLQESTRTSVETTALTRTFGWSGADGFEQHDVQELCRVLFDALERTFKGTEQETLISDLYQGKFRDYVKCTECHHESGHSDTFLDISLVIRPFGENKLMSSVEEAFRFYLKAELLEGGNQYDCARCNKKVDAIKGLKLEELPPLLSLQLKRFDFDYNTFQRIKLNNKVHFPLVLDMNGFVSRGDGEPRSQLQRQLSEEREELEASVAAAAAAASGDGDGDGDGKEDEAAGEAKNADADHEDPEEDDDDMPDLIDAHGNKLEEAEGSSKEPSFAEQRAAALANGPDAYELFSVLIHSGSALGGHYYAYVKSFTDGQWYNFNDSYVDRITVEQVYRAWGTDNTATYTSHANAYMLMYRRIDDSTPVPTTLEVPEHVREAVRVLEEAQSKELEERRARYNKINVKVRHGAAIKDFDCSRTELLEELLQRVVAEYYPEPDGDKEAGNQPPPPPADNPADDNPADDNPADDNPADDNQAAPQPPARPDMADCRLRVWITSTGKPGRGYETLAKKQLYALSVYNGMQLELDVREPGAAWEKFNPQSFTLNMCLYDPETDSFGSTLQVASNRDHNPGQFRKALAEQFPSISEDRVHLYKVAKSTATTVQHMNDAARSFFMYGVVSAPHCVIYVQPTVEPAATAPADLADKIRAHAELLELSHTALDGEEFSHKITFPKKATVDALYAAVRESLGLPEDAEIKLARVLSVSEVELKLGSPLGVASFGIAPGTKLRVTTGHALHKDEFIVKLCHFRASQYTAGLGADGAEPPQLADAPADGDGAALTPPPPSPYRDSNPTVTYVVNGRPLVPAATEASTDAPVTTATVVDGDDSEEAFRTTLINIPRAASDFTPVDDMVLRAGVKDPNHISEFRARVLERLRAGPPAAAAADDEDVDVAPIDVPADASVARLRLWETVAGRPALYGSVRDGGTFKSLFAGKNIVAEFVPADEDHRAVENIVLVRWWQRGTWTLSEPREVLLDTKASLHEMAEALGERTGAPGRVTHVLKVEDYDPPFLSNLEHCRWINCNAPEAGGKTLPAYQVVAGSLLLLMDEREPLRDITKGEEALIAERKRPTYSSATGDYTTTYSSRSYKPRPERGLKIRTHQEREEEKKAAASASSAGDAASSAPSAPVGEEKGTPTADSVAPAQDLEGDEPPKLINMSGNYDYEEESVGQAAALFEGL